MPKATERQKLILEWADRGILRRTAFGRWSTPFIQYGVSRSEQNPTRPEGQVLLARGWLTLILDERNYVRDTQTGERTYDEKAVLTDAGRAVLKDKRTAYKLLRVRRDGTLGPLFINRQQVIDVGRTYTAEAHPTKGFAFRPGWHCCAKPVAPHLSPKGRRWYVVEIENFVKHERPKAQGGLWFTAEQMTVLRPLETTT